MLISVGMTTAGRLQESEDQEMNVITRLTKHRAAVSIIVSLTVLVGLSLLIWHIANQPAAHEKDDTTVRTVERTGPDLLTPKRPMRKKGTRASQEDVDGFLAFLKEPTPTEEPVEESPSTPSAETKHETPLTGEAKLTYEEELRQRFLRISQTPEYKQINDRRNELTMEAYELGPPAWLQQAIYEYDHNPFCVFGVSKEEGFEMLVFGELAQEDLAYMREVRQQLDQLAHEYTAPLLANQRERAELAQQRRELLDMTEDEIRIALGRK